MIAAERVVERARSMLTRGTVYFSGKGGARPTAPAAFDEQRRLDCSGLVAWCLESPRNVKLPAYVEFLGEWLETTAIVRDAKSGATGMFAQVHGVPRPGDVIVYGDDHHGQGHCGIISAVHDTPGAPTLAQVAQVIHCSAGNYRRTKDAVQETAPDVFLKRSSTIVARCLGVDYGDVKAA